MKGTNSSDGGTYSFCPESILITWSTEPPSIHSSSKGYHIRKKARIRYTTINRIAPDSNEYRKNLVIQPEVFVFITIIEFRKLN